MNKIDFVIHDENSRMDEQVHKTFLEVKELMQAEYTKGFHDGVEYAKQEPTMKCFYVCFGMGFLAWSNKEWDYHLVSDIKLACNFTTFRKADAMAKDFQRKRCTHAVPLLQYYAILSPAVEAAK